PPRPPASRPREVPTGDGGPARGRRRGWTMGPRRPCRLPRRLEGAPVSASDIDQRIADLPVAVDLTEDAVILEVDLSGTAEQIWAHVTDPELLATWSPIVPERPLT